MVRQLTDRYGGIDGAFLNAGIYEPHALLGDDLDTWNRHLAVNLTGVLLGIRAAATADAVDRREHRRHRLDRRAAGRRA